MAAYRVLVIDDDTLFLEIARATLTRSGYCVEVVSDPREGVNRAIEKRFDLILLDLVMPGLQGEEVLRLLKPIGGQRIVVVSAHSAPIYRSRARDLGAVGYLEKPVFAQELSRIVGEILHAEIRSPAEDKPRSKGALDALATWVFGVGPVTPIKRAVAVCMVVGMGCIFLWLIWGA